MVFVLGTEMKKHLNKKNNNRYIIRTTAVATIFTLAIMIAAASSMMATPTSATATATQQSSQMQQQTQQPINHGASVFIVQGSSILTTDAYSPNAIQVSIGDTVIWINDDVYAHTVTSGSNGVLDHKFNSSPNYDPLIPPGARFSHTFTEVGEYPYFCLLHSNMVGTVSVS